MPDDMQQDVERKTNGGLRPVPDPSVLTTEQTQREIEQLKDLMEQRIAALKELLTCDIEGARAVREQEFRGVANQLAQVEQQRVEQKADTKAAVDAALTAQKEAVSEQTTASERSIAKSETATTKSIEQLGTTFTTDLGGVRREISDLKERMTSVEQQKVGREENKNEHRAGVQPFQIALLGGMMTLFITVVVVVLNIATGS